MAVVLIANEKGGVGKTTLALNLAHGLAGRGHRTLVVDNDAQGNLSQSMVAEPTAFTSKLYRGSYDQPQPVAKNLYLWAGGETLKPFVSGTPAGPTFTELIRRTDDSGKFKFLIIDTAPTFSDLNLAAWVAATDVLIPATPSAYSLEGVGAAVKEFRRLRDGHLTRAKMNGIVLTMVSKTIVHRQYAKLFREKYPRSLYESRIPRFTVFEEAASMRQCVEEYEPDGHAAWAMSTVIDEFLDRIGE